MSDGDERLRDAARDAAALVTIVMEERSGGDGTEMTLEAASIVMPRPGEDGKAYRTRLTSTLLALAVYCDGALHAPPAELLGVESAEERFSRMRVHLESKWAERDDGGER